MITPDVISAHNLTREEFERITSLLGREPNLVELGIFSVMWSEHCSYKSSRVHLKRLPTTGERVIVPPGENAGVVARRRLVRCLQNRIPQSPFVH